jgi:transcriptional regulator with XRE-family HTH domain
MTRDRDLSGCRPVPPGVALMPEDFPRRLAALKELTGLTWEGMADALGVDPRQLLRWRKRDGEPNGGAMLSLDRLADRVPGGRELLLYGDYTAIRIARR